MTAARVLGEFVAELNAGALPAEVAERMRAHVLVDLACGMAAEAPVEPLLRGAGPPEAGIVGRDERAPAETAALVNGAILHARAQDDTHYPSQTHPGAAVLPAALALAEREGRDGARLLAALVAGYEASAAVGEPLADAVVARGFRAASLFGTLGAAAAAASILGLGADRAGDALAIAAGFAGGLTETWLAGSDEWPWQLGAAARSGVTAALLAGAGVTGAATALEGRSGLAAAFGGERLPQEWELGRRWRTLEVVYKPYPVCNITQAPVLLAAGLRARLGSARVHAARCFLNPADRDYPGTLNRGPFPGAGAALMSAPYCVAMGLAHGTATVAALRGEPALLELAERVEVLADDRLPPLSARLEVDGDDGARHAAELVGDTAPYRSGWPEALALCGRLAAEIEDGPARLDRLRAAVETFADAGELIASTRR